MPKSKAVKDVSGIKRKLRVKTSITALLAPSAQSGLDRPARRAASGTQRSLPLRQWKEIQEMLRQHGQTSLIRMRIAKHIVE
jgi:hypothetical protein